MAFREGFNPSAFPDWAWFLEQWKNTLIKLDEIGEDNERRLQAAEQLANDLKTFVNNYFDNLDVQREINNKIDVLVASGRFLQIAEPTITANITEWLIDNITQPDDVVIDASLTIAGACADAKATGDADKLIKKDLAQAFECVNYEKSIAVNFEHGNYIRDGSTSVVYKNPTADPAVLNIRIRCTNYLEFPYPVTIKTADGYSAEAWTLTRDNVRITFIDWFTINTIPANTRFVFEIKNNDNHVLNLVDVYSYISFERDTVFGHSNRIAGNFNTGVTFNFTPVASTIRGHICNIMRGALRFTIKDGYMVETIPLLPNGNNGGNRLYYVGTHDYLGQNSYINIQKTDNSPITIREMMDNVTIESIPDSFSFEGGSTYTTDSGYFAQNNDPVAFPIRLRSNVMYIDKSKRVIAKSGYQLEVLEYEADGEKIQNVTNGFTDECILTGGKYYCIVVKKVDGGSLYAGFVDDYITITDYSVASRPYKVLFIGDSITEDNWTAQFNWTKRLTAMFKFTETDNVAIGGTGIIAGGANGWLQKLPNFPQKDYDLILIMGNMNDYSNNIFNPSTLGTFDDSGTSTEYGALKTFVQALTNKYKYAKIGWIISTPRQYYSGDPDNPNPTVVEGSLYGIKSLFETATKAIKDVCGNYSIPCIDLYHASNFRCWDASVKDKYFYNDGNCVHPNDAGNEVIAQKISAWVLANF